jgi:hypothetical protein
MRGFVANSAKAGIHDLCVSELLVIVSANRSNRVFLGSRLRGNGGRGACA